MTSPSHTSSTNALSTESLRIDAKKLSLNLKNQNKHKKKHSFPKSARYQYNQSSSNLRLQRPKSASGSYTLSTFSTRRNDAYGPFAHNRPKSKQKQKQRPHTAHPHYLKSKKDLLDQSLHRLYPTRDELIPPKYSVDQIQRALRLQTQYQKTLQKRSRFINKMSKPKFRSLSKNVTCYYSKLKSQEMLLYESPYHSMNVEHYNYRPLNKPNKIPWDLRMYNKPKPVDHLSTKSQMITINATESYKKINSMINNMYRPSVKKFFGEEYDLKTGLDPKYIYEKQHHKRPIYV